MIDARRFATVYNAFWQSTTPTCELFVRRVNLDGYERLDPPLDGPREGGRQALAAEYAFARLAIQHQQQADAVQNPLGEEVHALAWQAATDQLSPYAVQGLDIETPFREEERIDALKITDRLMKFFSRRRLPLTIRPCFRGCGYIDTSQGDVMFGSTLFEVKTVDRMIRGIDIRQLLTYAALNKNAKCYNLSHIGLYNPRRGIAAEFELEDVCLGISGKSSEALLSEIIETASSGEMSR